MNMKTGFMPYMNMLEDIWHNGKYLDTNIAYCILNAALEMKNMQYEEIVVALDINCVHFIYDTSFTSICIYDTMQYMSFLKNIATEHVYMHYIHAMEHFCKIIKKIQIEDTWSR